MLLRGRDDALNNTPLGAARGEDILDSLRSGEPDTLSLHCQNHNVGLLSSYVKNLFIRRMSGIIL